MTAAAQPKLVDIKTPATISAPKADILLRMIAPSPWNRRAEPSADFIASIKESGVTADILVRPVVATEEHVILAKPAGAFAVGDSIYEIVFGERRYRASIINNFDRIPAKVRELSDIEALKLQVDENEQRENLSAMDRCLAYKNVRDQLMKDHAGERGYTETKCIAEVSEIVKKEIRTVYQVLALSKLHLFLQQALTYGELEASHGYEICRLDEDQQNEVLKWIRTETRHSQGDIPSVRRLKREISQMQPVWDARKRQAALPLEGAHAQTSAVDENLVNPSLPRSAMDEYKKQKAAAPKPLREAQIENNRSVAAKLDSERVEREKKEKLSVEIEQEARYTAMVQISQKVKLDRSLINEVLAHMLATGDDAPAQFAVTFCGWPKPKNKKHFSYAEIQANAKKMLPKMKPSRVAALLAACLLDDELSVYQYNIKDCEKLDSLARRYKVDLPKIRKAVQLKGKAETKKVKA